MSIIHWLLAWLVGSIAFAAVWARVGRELNRRHGK